MPLGIDHFALPQCGDLVAAKSGRGQHLPGLFAEFRPPAGPMDLLVVD
jgi:hypothetical protein